MNNDFDFIKERIDNSGVKAPANMDESYVMQQLEGKVPRPVAHDPSGASAQPAVKQPKLKNKPRRIAALAASLVLVAGAATGIGVAMHQRTAIPVVSETTGLIQFRNYDEVHAAMKKISDRSSRLYMTKTGRYYYGAVDEEADFAAPEGNGSKAAAAAPDSAQSDANGSAGGSSARSHSDTYKQVEGVDEADIIKTDGSYIYAVDQNWSAGAGESYVSIFAAEPGTTEPLLQIDPFAGEIRRLAPATGDEATPDEKNTVTAAFDSDSAYINDIYVRDNRLVILTGETIYDSAADSGYRYNFISYSRAYVYDVSDMADVRLLDAYSQSGDLSSSRMIGDTLYLISCEYSDERIPVCGRGATPSQIPADCIYSVEEPSENTFLIVGAYDTRDGSAATESKAILGAAEDVYCNEQNLYITATEYNYRVWLYDDVVWDGEEEKDSDADYDTITTGESTEDDDTVKTKIFKVSLTDGIAFTAYGEVSGYINNQYSLDEYNGFLRVAATAANDDYEDINNLYVLDSDLNTVGSVTGFAETESIKAVRYVGDTAYVITYEQTDPLFVIDLSSPAAPRILGEVKISGFSTMLVPVDANTILGLGINTGEYDYTSMEVQDGFKLALFDVSDKTSPAVLDSKSYVNYSSAVMWNPKALVYNPERNDYVVPLSYYYFDYESIDYDALADDDDWQDYYETHTEQFGAVLNFRIENGAIVETMLYRTDHSRIDRCVYVGDTIYMTYTDSSGALRLDSVSYR